MLRTGGFKLNSFAGLETDMLDGSSHVGTERFVTVNALLHALYPAGLVISVQVNSRWCNKEGALYVYR